jgi:4-diphosphocytidyl-2-C-methyl-D-erythritol kinase
MHNAPMSYSQHGQKAGRVHFVQSYAKINLTLDVLGRRADGYHDLLSIMQTIDLYDTICLMETHDEQVRIVCTYPELNTEDNLAVRAVQAVRQKLGLTQGVTIELHKRIPVAAGLGGGSSNAATVLLALQQWWQLQLSSSDMLTLATSLGSDVAFFLSGGLALCEGRGDRVTPLAPHWPASMRWLLLVKPAMAVSTAAVFHALPTSDYTDGSHSRAVRAALDTGSELQQEDLHNGLERGVLARYPQVAQAREALLRAGAPFVRLTGSGPTLFAPFAELAHAAHVQQQLHAQGYKVYLSRAIHPSGKTVCLF